jgi:hypothetical protein
VVVVAMAVEGSSTGTAGSEVVGVVVVIVAVMFCSVFLGEVETGVVERSREDDGVTGFLIFICDDSSSFVSLLFFLCSDSSSLLTSSSPSSSINF